MTEQSGSQWLLAEVREHLTAVIGRPLAEQAETFEVVLQRLQDVLGQADGD
jgi:hypothetical protein